jgi:acetoacetyl-CoA synthetase
MNDQAIWTPSPERVRASNLARFMSFAGERAGERFDDYETLQRWSVRQREDFWSALWEFCDIRASRPWDSILTNGDAMPGAKWFEGARLNFAENLLRYRDDKPAIVFRGEDGRREQLSYAQLHDQVARLAGALRQAGVGAGDRVAGFMPNRPEAIIAMLATTSVGAVWSSCSPDFGSNGVLDRFGQIEPVILFTTDGYLYNGREIDCIEPIGKVLRQLDSVRQLVVVPFVNDAPDISALDSAVMWNDFLSTESAIEFEQLPFDQPIYIMYSSGTTGVPKCIVHGAGGTLLQHMKELQLHTDLRREDVIFYFTTCGWMMWNWLVSALATGSTVVLYDGSPFRPEPGSLWKMAQDEGVTIFGTSAKYISALENAHEKPGENFDLSELRTLLSTGSPLSPENFDYVYRDIKQDLQLSSIAGGTDIISCFSLGCPVKSVYAGELQCLGLGMAVEIFDDDGNPVEGEMGELVCTRPFPSMPVCFWNDEKDCKYHEAYFERFDNVWCHGDLAEITQHRGLIIHGRSDAVLNPGGVRIGTAEIYRQVEKLDEIVESIAIGQDWEGDVRVVLFVRLQDGMELTDELEHSIRTTIRREATPRHVPAIIAAVTDIPRTISGKIVELAVRNVVHGRPVRNTDALANPDALEQYRDRAELQAN